MSEIKSNHQRKRGGIFFPLLLVFIGIVILLVNLRVVTGDVWNLLIQLWPILLIVIGLDSIYKREGLVAPTFMIGVGVIFLLANLGYLGVSVWQMILTLWPILIIAIGFDILVGRRSLLLSLLGMAVIIVILVGSLWFFGASFTRGEVISGEQVHQTLDGATRAEVNIEAGAGELQVGDLSEAGVLLDGRIPGDPRGKIQGSYKVTNGVGSYRLSEPGAQFIQPRGVQNKWKWDLDVTNSVPVDLSLGMGAGSVLADLRNLNLDVLEVNLAVGESRVTLPDQGRLDAKIQGAIGQIIIIVPSGVGVQIQADTGLTSLQVPESYVRVGHMYESPGYDSAQTQVDISVSMAIGSVVIRQE